MTNEVKGEGLPDDQYTFAFEIMQTKLFLVIKLLTIQTVWTVPILLEFLDLYVVTGISSKWKEGQSLWSAHTLTPVSCWRLYTHPRSYILLCQNLNWKQFLSKKAWWNHVPDMSSCSWMDHSQGSLLSTDLSQSKEPLNQAASSLQVLRKMQKASGIQNQLHLLTRKMK